MNKNVELQLTNDYIFKRLFSKKGNEDILKDLLEGILEIPIKEVEVMQEVELERLDIKDKLGVLDIKAIINENITVDIEMQIANEKNMIERTLYYWAGLYYTGLKRGKDYKLNNKVITINILMYNIFKKDSVDIIYYVEYTQEEIECLLQDFINSFSWDKHLCVCSFLGQKVSVDKIGLLKQSCINSQFYRSFPSYIIDDKIKVYISYYKLNKGNIYDIDYAVNTIFH